MIHGEKRAGGMMIMNLSVFVGVCADFGTTHWILFRLIHTRQGVRLIPLVPLLEFISFSFLWPLPLHPGLAAKSRFMSVSIRLVRYFGF